MASDKQVLSDSSHVNAEKRIDSRFPIIRALCRAALAAPNAAVVQQVRRLADSYKHEGFTAESEALQAMLIQSDDATAFAPSKLVRSRLTLQGEQLTERTALPVDRETSTRLVDVIFPEQLPSEAPVFDGDLQLAVSALIDEWAHWDALKAMDVTPTHSCLIYGAPGTGKTRLALWMARQLGLPIVVARLDGLVSSFLGTTSRNIGSLFQFANRYRCVLLLDEFDAVAKVRDDPQEVGEIKRVVNTLLQNLDSRRDLGITIGITNHEQLLDAAVWRRFDAQLAVSRPSFKTRVAIAREYLSPLPVSETQIKLIAWLTDGLSGAEIESLTRSIRKGAAIEGADFDFLAAVRRLATLNAGRVPSARRDALNQDDIHLAGALYSDSIVGFDQKALAALFAKDPTTISRWLKERQNLA